MKKRLAEIDGTLYYLAMLYDEHENFIGEEWVPAEKFDTLEEANDYLRRPEDGERPARRET